MKLVGVKDLVGAKKYHDAFCVQPMLIEGVMSYVLASVSSASPPVSI